MSFLLLFLVVDFELLYNVMLFMLLLWCDVKNICVIIFGFLICYMCFMVFVFVVKFRSGCRCGYSLNFIFVFYFLWKRIFLNIVYYLFFNKCRRICCNSRSISKYRLKDCYINFIIFNFIWKRRGDLFRLNFFWYWKKIKFNFRWNR